MSNFKYLTVEELRKLHGNEVLRLVIAMRARIQKMGSRRVAESTGCGLQCVLDFVSGVTRLPRLSTLSLMLELVVGEESVANVADTSVSVIKGCESVIPKSTRDWRFAHDRRRRKFIGKAGKPLRASLLGSAKRR